MERQLYLLVACSFRIMLQKNGRGWLSKEDAGNNNSYYLYADYLYRTLSPNYMYEIGHARAIYVDTDGHVGDGWVDKSEGGVRYSTLLISQCFRIMLTL